MITSEDIANAPHKDLYDIVATYVPGLLLMSHTANTRIGIPGIIADRNYKFLLLVNGRNINRSDELSYTANQKIQVAPL